MPSELQFTPIKKPPRINSVRKQSLGLYAHYFHIMFNGRTLVLLVTSIYFLFIEKKAVALNMLMLPMNVCDTVV